MNNVIKSVKGVFLISSVSVSAIIMPSAAMAQTADDEGIREIIVTGQKRSESIQEAALAISALDTQALEQSGINNAEGLTAIIPNVAVRPFNNSVIVATRGISNENISNLGDASLAFHVNGIYVARPRSAAALFYDVERVELLRGPQGTLYGRNSTAGALNVITKRPETDKIAGGADVSYGNYNALTTRGYVNLPLSDNAALRAAIFYTNRDGYAISNRAVPLIPQIPGPPPGVSPDLDAANAGIGATNAANLNISSIKNGDDDGEIAGRLSFLYEPADKLSWVLTGQYQETDEIGQVRSAINTPGYFAVTGPFTGQLFLPQQQDPSNPRISSNNTQAFNRVKNWDITSELTYELTDSVDITMVTGYRSDRNSLQVDAGGASNLSVINTASRADQISNEIRLTSRGDGPFQWIVGGYYFDEDQADDVFINNVGGGPFNVVGANVRISSASMAAFGQATYAISEKFKLIAGARYTDDKKKRFGYTLVAPGLTVAPDPLPPGASYTNNQSWNRFNWKLGFDYDINDNAKFYATVSTGYRAGGFNNSSELAYDPEDITAYEVGLKTDLLDRTLRLNFAGFYYDYKDLQVTSPRELDGRIQAFTQNAASAKIWGLEIEAIVRPSRNLSFDFALGYLNTKFGDFQSIDNICTAAGLTLPAQFLPGCVTSQRFNSNGTPVLVPASPAPGAPLVPVFDLQQVNYKGNQLANAPDLTLNLGVNWTLFDNGSGSLTARGAVRLVGESFLSEYNRGPDRVASYAQTEARLTYSSENKRFTLEAFVQNLEDNAIPGSLTVTASGYGVSYLPPRTYGARVGVQF